MPNPIHPLVILPIGHGDFISPIIPDAPVLDGRVFFYAQHPDLNTNFLEWKTGHLHGFTAPKAAPSDADLGFRPCDDPQIAALVRTRKYRGEDPASLLGQVAIVNTLKGGSLLNDPMNAGRITPIEVVASHLITGRYLRPNGTVHRPDMRNLCPVISFMAGKPDIEQVRDHIQVFAGQPRLWQSAHARLHARQNIEVSIDLWARSMKLKHLLRTPTILNAEGREITWL